MPELLAVLRGRRGQEVSSYKLEIFSWSVRRRMSQLGVRSVVEYWDLLLPSDVELDALIRELLIGTTSFFRDGKPWEDLTTEVERCARAVPNGSMLRAWVPGCSTGQDAFSLAMIMQEVLARTGRGVSGRVFGTDINSEAVDVGRRAFYPARIRNEVSRARLSRFFSSRGGKFRVRPALRPMVIFGQQNVLTDPPIIDLDVLICRNLLIYFDVPTRERILAVFHYALRPGALLMLGTACNIAGESQLFSPVEGSRCVYRRNQDLHGQRTPMWPAVAANARLRRSRPVADSTAGVEADRKAQRLDGSERRSETVQELVNMNEQLETSKEELASLNEELRLTNNALALQVERSTKAQDDLSNLVRYAGLAAVFVSNDLRILRFTEPMRPFMPLRPTDVGRPLSDIAHTLKYERFIEDAREAVESLQVKETATTMGDTSVLVRMSPYQTGENSVDGLLIAFVSVDAFVRSLAAAGSGLRARAGSLEDGLILLGK